MLCGWNDEPSWSFPGFGNSVPKRPCAGSNRIPCSLRVMVTNGLEIWTIFPERMVCVPVVSSKWSKSLSWLFQPLVLFCGMLYVVVQQQQNLSSVQVFARGPVGCELCAHDQLEDVCANKGTGWGISGYCVGKTIVPEKRDYLRWYVAYWYHRHNDSIQNGYSSSFGSNIFLRNT